MNTETIHGTECPAGFWRRLCANLLDLIVIVFLVVSAARLAAYLGWYVPIEITVLFAFAAYAIGSEACTGRTVGKWLCGLTVTGKDGGVPRTTRLILRVTLGKVLFLFPFVVRFSFGALNGVMKWISLLVLLALGASFVWCAFDRKKRAWHDWIAGTIVTRSTPPFGPWSMGFAVAGIALVLIWFLGVPGRISIARDRAALKPTKTVPYIFEQRDSKDLVETASLDKVRQASYAEWLKTNAVIPVEYAVAKAQQHQVLVFGELHETKDHLDFLNELIPQLYRRAGVTTVAMETCLADDNPELERLVTDGKFDRRLAMRLARHQLWGTWGFKEYWDVFDTVWRLNQIIPSNQKKMRIIGLESRFDQQSLAMTMGEDQESFRKYIPWWEMRRLRVISSIPKVDARDLQMAARIEREIFKKGEHAIVWVGQAHAHACPVILSNGERYSRMGALLRQKHGGDIFFIWLHGPATPMSGAIEALMNQSGWGAAGFDTSASPLGLLRDKAFVDFQFEPRLALNDMADGYVYLKPSRELTECTWITDYITPAMFAANKPFYQAFGQRAGRPLNSAEEANAFFQNPTNMP